MEHEIVNDKCVALSMRGTKITARMLAMAMQEFLKMGGKAGSKLLTKRGEQSLKSLSKKGELDNIEISDDNIGSFRKIARKYKLDFSLKKDSSPGPPRWIVFFKAKDERILKLAFNEYAKITLKQKSRNESMLEKLDRFKEHSRLTPEKIIERVKNKSKEAFR